MMGRCPGVPFDPGMWPQGGLSASAVILHRTYGSWGGDYSVGKGTGREGIGFHFLVGRDDGNVMQFYDTATKCSHASGANSWSVGIEFEGTNDEPLTENQLYWGGEIIRWLTGDVGLSLAAYYDGPRKGESEEYRGHRTVEGSDHGDYITRSDYDKMIAGGDPLAEEEDTMQLIPEFAGQLHYFYVGDGGDLWHAWWGHSEPFGRQAERIGELADYDGQPSACVIDDTLHVVCDRQGSEPPAHHFMTAGVPWGTD